MEGWIKLHRKITENWIWNDKPFSRGQAWIDLLMRVNHKDGKALIGNKLVEVKRGQTIWSILDMADRWGWSRKKVSNFLNTLESEGMIMQKRTTKYTLITIENYDIYQDTGTTEEQQENIKRTSKEQQKNTNKNDNNDNNDKKNIYSDAVKEIFDYYLETFKGFFKTYSLTKDRRQKIEARLKEGYTVEQIKTAISHIRQSPFHCGENDRNKFYADISFICRNGGKLEEWINYQPPAQETQKKKEIPQSVLEQIRQNEERVKKMKYDPKYLEEVKKIVQQS